MKRTAVTAGLALAIAGLAVTQASLLPARAAPAAAKYTATQVAAHNTTSDCWTIVGKGVYNLTGYASRHPGGSSAIARLCGTNATRAFAAQHGGQGAATAALRSMKIGTLAKG